MTTYSNNGRGPDPADPDELPLDIQTMYDVDDERAAWLEKWAPKCPIGNPQRLRMCVGYREREPGRLQLRVPLTRTEGVCEVIVEEHEETILVRVLVCYEEDPDDDLRPEYVDCPVHVYLDQPLNDRAVIDEDTREPLALFVPHWG
jgi:hypothetical protein